MSYIVTRVRESVRNLANIWCYMQHSRNVASRACDKVLSTPIRAKHFHRLSFIFAAHLITTIFFSRTLPRISHTRSFQNRSIDRASALSPFLVVQVVAHVTVRTFLPLLNSERVVTMLGAMTSVLLTASSIEYLSSQMFQKVGCFDPSSIETLDTLRRGSGGSDNSSVSSSIPKKPVVGG